MAVSSCTRILITILFIASLQLLAQSFAEVDDAIDETSDKEYDVEVNEYDETDDLEEVKLRDQGHMKNGQQRSTMRPISPKFRKVDDGAFEKYKPKKEEKKKSRDPRNVLAITTNVSKTAPTQNEDMKMLPSKSYDKSVKEHAPSTASPPKSQSKGENPSLVKKRQIELPRKGIASKGRDVVANATMNSTMGHLKPQPTAEKPSSVKEGETELPSKGIASKGRDVVANATMNSTMGHPKSQPMAEKPSSVKERQIGKPLPSKGIMSKSRAIVSNATMNSTVDPPKSYVSSKNAPKAVGPEEKVSLKSSSDEFLQRDNDTSESKQVSSNGTSWSMAASFMVMKPVVAKKMMPGDVKFTAPLRNETSAESTENTVKTSEITKNKTETSKSATNRHNTYFVPGNSGFTAKYGGSLNFLIMMQLLLCVVFRQLDIHVIL